MEKKSVSTNRKAFHDYSILETYDAGLVLKGYEVKALRNGLLNLSDSYIGFSGGEAFLSNAHIGQYENQSTHITDFDPLRKRKLLVKKTEIKHLFDITRTKGLLLIPLEVYFSTRGIAKIKIGLAKGKNVADKRETIKKKEAIREIKKEMKNSFRT